MKYEPTRNPQKINGKLSLIPLGLYFVFFLYLFSLYPISPTSYLLHAQTTPTLTATTNVAVIDLQSKINQKTDDIRKLEAEIATYSKQITELGSQASSLSATIKSLQLTQKKLETDIKITENKIIEKNIQIQLLGSQISDKEETITDDRRIITRSYAQVNELGNRSLPELFLKEKSLSSAWDSLDNIGILQKGLIYRIAELQNVKANLEINKKTTEKAKIDLGLLSKQLTDQKKIIIDNANETSALLKETKNNQTTYTKLLATRQEQKDTFEREVLDLESQLKFTLDPSGIPHTGSGVLTWPISAATKITQYFGNTEFAAANSQIYNGKGHTGVDFRASIGTQIKASLSGTVVGVANTDSIRGCYSYGKWIMIKHPNGLSTLYAHLSLPAVTIGQEVSTAQVIGYSGNTGASTGPHLHFGVYATDGVKIQQLTRIQSSRCAGATIPLAAFGAYLNPLSYL